jgi:adenosylcobinamide amidohydrolase
VLFEQLASLPSERATALRRTSGRLGLKGTIVGISANLDVTGERVTCATNEEINVSALALRRWERRAAGSESQEKFLDTIEYGSVLIFVDGRLSHEAMLEAMALAAETRFRVGCHELPSGGPPEPVAIASLEDSAARFRGDADELRKLIVEVLRQCFSA